MLRNTQSGSVFNNILVLKVDKNGNLIWLKKYNNSESYEGKDIIINKDNSFYILSQIHVLAGRENCSHLMLMKCNKFGDTIWTKRFENKCDFQCGNMKATNDGGLIIIGTSTSDNLGLDSVYSSDIYLIKLKSNGNIEWEKKYGTNNADYGVYVCLASDNSYLFIGNYFRNTNYKVYKDLLLYKINSSGDMVWNKIFNTNGFIHSNTVFEDNNKCIIVGATCLDYDSDKEEEIMLLRLNGDGSQ